VDAFGSGWKEAYDTESGGLSGELSTWNSAPRQIRQRKSERTSVDLGAGLRQRGASGVSVRVMDLSPHGFRAATHLELPEGTDVWLRLPGLEPFHARVAWCEGHYVGCAFDRPLHPAVVDMIVRKASGNA
jgi:hypothetical protein